MKRILLIAVLIFSVFILSACGEEIVFKNGTHNSYAKELALVIEAEEVPLLDNFTKLKTLDLSGSTCYKEIEAYKEAHPDVALTYTVDLGNIAVPFDTESLVINEGEAKIEALVNNLEYLRSLKSLDLSNIILSREQIEALLNKYPNLDIKKSISLFGKEYSYDTKELELSDIKPEDITLLGNNMEHLLYLEKIKLNAPPDGSSYALSDLEALSKTVPGLTIDYSFNFYGLDISLADTSMEFDGVHFGTEALPEIRSLLSLMPNLEYLKLADAGIPSEEMQALKEEFPSVKIIWRVYFGEYMHCLTDEETIRAIFRLNDKNCYELRYCEDVKYMDIGHNSDLTDTSFIAHMPKLEIVILSGSPFTDTTPFANCPNLQFLELVWCGNVKEISSLKNCTNLEYLNLCYNQVTDLSPLDDLPLKRFMYYSPKLTAQQQQEFIDKHPDCWTNFSGLNPYVLGWRYDDQGFTWCDMYKKVREVFRYEENFYNNS